MIRLLLFLVLFAAPMPPAARILDLCGHIPDNGAPWYYEDGFGNPLPCPGDAPPPPMPRPTPTPPPPTYTWSGPGRGVVTWEGPGTLIKRRGALAAVEATSATAGTVHTEVPGPPPVDIFWRPFAGDEYCTAGGCVTVDRYLAPRVVLPLIGR